MTNEIFDWWQRVLPSRRANEIANTALEECWMKVRAKAASLSPAEVADYIRQNSGSLVHRYVDALVRDNPSIDASSANRLIVKATDRLTRRIMQRLAKQTRRLPRAG
jgi:hypothetical protein